jgi:hypothetical protein
LDVGVVMIARTELQRGVDAASLAGAWGLIEKAREGVNPWDMQAQRNGKEVAQEYVRRNMVIGKAPHVALNIDNGATDDLVLGTFSPDTRSFTTGTSPRQFNALRVRVQRAGSSSSVGGCQLRLSPYRRRLTIRAGFPATIVYGGTSQSTTVAEPTIAPAPIVAPPSTTARAPIQAFSPM